MQRIGFPTSGLPSNPAEAYQQELVKRIEVDGVLQEDDANQPLIRVNDIQRKKNILIARLSVQKLMRDGTVKEQSVTVGPGDNLAEKTNRQEYSDYIVDEINLFSDFVRFTNGVEVERGGSKGEDKDAILRHKFVSRSASIFVSRNGFKSSNIRCCRSFL